MPQIKSAKKRVLTTERNRVRNMAFKSAIRTAMKKVLTGLTETQVDGAALQQRLNDAYSIIDRAILKGILHKNTGARYKARLAQQVFHKAAG